ncbi:asparagine synthase (glutamine-hydrolyzing) [Nitratiruptor tergarcus]|uniref:asparagine synthase (glutamine-hydrolyzing) n=1 Tax=Nitratiruptor tergarcus DSM 16512 TaxID=1069081 RepID=A0A1W1WQL3_9BACT|nr:asparagine synthase (glutamine-hydrolyzing) [Nitratiruptor tergarcus]SMC08499.1 asparagine synthase (glutamine-hydrolysing) [Nitratiruptor tergarcus DSM 16512]
MCAIFGVIGKIDREKALNAFSLLSHRGEDESGVYEREGVFLAHHRLYILNKDAKQPFVQNSKVLLFNGEIYNYEDFHTSEAAAILEVAPDFSKLDGMFALALLDKEKLYLARDLFGKKPLYYAFWQDSFIFASEIKAILAYTNEQKINARALSSYLSFGAVVGRETFYEGIYKLDGGEILELDIKRLYYACKRFTTLLQKRSGDLKRLLVAAVKKRLQGDFPAVALLSGGVDSSFVSAIAKRLQGSLATYSIGYEEGRYSELPYAQEVAQYIGSDHHEIIFTKDDFFATLERASIFFDEPIGDSASLPLFYLMERIKKDGAKVVLSGEGGDEIFLGYRQYFEFFDLYKARDLKYKNWLKNYFRSNFSPNKEWEWYKRVFSDEVIFRSSCEVFTDLQKNLFLRQNVKDNESLQVLQPYLEEWERSGWKDGAAFFTYIDIKVRLQSLYLAKLDTTSMAYTIEARTPLLDSSVLYSAFADPQRSKAPKYLLKKIASKYIPQSIIERKKRGFSYPALEWLQSSGSDQKLREANKRFHLFKQEQLEFLIENAKRNRFTRHYWLVYALLDWMERKF